MRKSVCMQWFERYLKEVSLGHGQQNHKNPAIEFTHHAKEGRYDVISDQEYEALLSEVEELASFWNLERYHKSSELLLAFIEKLNIDAETLHKMAELFAECYETSTKPFVSEDVFPDQKEFDESCEDEECWRDMDQENDSRETECSNRAGDWFQYEGIDVGIMSDPKKIYTYLSSRIYGQEEAVKAASMLLYNHRLGRKRNLLFAGPTGCGKTEIWRVLKQIYPHIRIIDSTMITMEGWSGSFKIRDIFTGLTQEEAEKSIIVFDEFDKFCEPKASVRGDCGFANQSELLKMIEGAKIVFPADRGKPLMEFDSSKISFVFCGSFELLMKEKAKAEEAGSIGFGAAIRKQVGQPQEKTEIVPEDLVRYANIRLEIAGRIHQIVQLYPMTAQDYDRILLDEQISPLHQLEKQYEVKLHLNACARKQIIEKAVETHMGVRYLRSRIQQLLDEQMFQNCGQTEYRLGEE